jgi:hypothetical protein
VKDREDKEWLGKQHGLVPAGSSVGGKACYVMVLNDVLELAAAEEYASHPRRKPAELVNAGFHAPPFMIDKMQRLMNELSTDPSVSDEQLLEKANAEIQMGLITQNDENKTQCRLTRNRNLGANRRNDASNNIGASASDIKTKVKTAEQSNSATNSDHSSKDSKQQELIDTRSENTAHKEDGNSCLQTQTGQIVPLIHDMKLQEAQSQRISEEGEQQQNDVELADAGSVEEDDLGSLLHGVNLNSLVREFEMEAACVAAAAAAEASEGDDIVGDDVDGTGGQDVCDDDVAQLGGLLALADDCEGVSQNPASQATGESPSKYSEK